MLLHKEKTKRKFRFVEDFDEEDWKEQFEEDEEENPKFTDTRFFGKKELRQIAKVEWEEVVITRETEKTDSRGRTTVVEEDVVYYHEVMGELGGWLEHEFNLSQEGECWVDTDSRVMGEARVYEDAKVSGGAEIGDAARVFGEVEIKGPVGIGGTARVKDKAKIEGSPRLAVFGSATVMGESKVLGEAKVYGNATVGYDLSKNLYLQSGMIDSSGYYESLGTGAVISGNARAYGSSTIYGTVSDYAEAYGRAKIYGWVFGEAQVGGTANVAYTGQVSGKVRLLKGDVFGTLKGERCDILYPRFYLGSSSVFSAKADGSGEDEEDSLPAEKKDKMRDRETKRYEGKVRSLIIFDDCDVSGCEFEGGVELYGCQLRDCKVSDCILGAEDEDISPLRDGLASYKLTGFGGSMANLVASGCDFENCLLPLGEYRDSELKNCVVCREWIKSYYNYFNFFHKVSGSKLDGCVILKNSMSVGSCELKNVTVDSVSISKKKIEDCAVIQSVGDSRLGIFVTKYQKNIDAKHNVLILPDKYGDYLGKNRWGEMHGVDSLPRIATYVMKFDGLPDKLYWEADQTLTQGMYDEYSKLVENLQRAAEERKKWFADTIAELAEREKQMADDGYIAGALAISRLYVYLESISTDKWFLLSEAAFNRVKNAIRDTIASFDGTTFIPLADLGELELDDSLKTYEEKYGISVGRVGLA
ncbi:MAG: hypothetical protein J6Q22_09380 [Prevotella sp.]|nr:hypothetical protein [Prevotella sp.]